MTMSYSFFAQVAHLYTEILISIIILIMGAIGYFYQSKFNYKTYYQLFIVAAFLILSVFLHFFISNYVLIQLIEMMGLLVAMILSIKLYQTMTGSD
ncbi:MAG: hypothetical protein C5S44_03865 [Candidatus Methanocomedens sp.]|jgi:hypothetical protein|nr:MAG: hypothetical protein C5S45_08070 [ANME-2 cluster archaeon]KAF5423042.1 MAG: hypothetical protein C5S44_03865 [ANME-2 cluster archaeon]